MTHGIRGSPALTLPLGSGTQLCFSPSGRHHVRPIFREKAIKHNEKLTGCPAFSHSGCSLVLTGTRGETARIKLFLEDSAS